MDIPEKVLEQFYYPNVKDGDKVIDTSKITDTVDNLEPDGCDYLVINNSNVYELYVLAGARQTIRKYKPNLLIMFNVEHEGATLSDTIQFISDADPDYDYIINADYYNDKQRLYMYSWINHGQRIAGRRKRIIGDMIVGYLSPAEIKGRNMIRARTIPGSGGPNPDVYQIKFMPGRTIKYRRSKIDAWNSWFEFASEVDVRQKFWYPNIAKGDNVVDAGAGWGSYAITAALMGAVSWAYEPHPTYVMDMAENARLNGVFDKVHMFQAGLSDKNRIIDWDELKNMQLVALDEHLNRKIDFLKIDVEGQELAVLKGARQTIAKYKPKILLEAHLTYNKRMIPDAAEYIMKLADGYQEVVYDCIPSGDCIYVYFHNTSD